MSNFFKDLNDRELMEKSLFTQLLQLQKSKRIEMFLSKKYESEFDLESEHINEILNHLDSRILNIDMQYKQHIREETE